MTYVIGGIFDKNANKKMSLDRAKALKVKSMRLPLENFFEGNKNKCINVAQCFFRRL